MRSFSLLLLILMRFIPMILERLLYSLPFSETNCDEIKIIYLSSQNHTTFLSPALPMRSGLIESSRSHSHFPKKNFWSSMEKRIHKKKNSSLSERDTRIFTSTLYAIILSFPRSSQVRSRLSRFLAKRISVWSRSRVWHAEFPSSR